MASLFDIALLNQFSIIFVILFIFTAAYAVLTFKNPFGPNKGINALLAFTIAMMFIFVPDAIEIVKATVPWLIIMMIALMFVYLTTASIGASLPASLMRNIGNWILIIGIIILVLNISLKLGQRAGPFLGNESIDPDSVIAGGEGDVASGSYAQNLGATLFHPRVLALLVVLIVALFAVLFIGQTPPIY